MSSIPGAHASLGFGRKRIDFYASPGVTTGEGPRRGEHEIRDADGATHTMRLSRPDTPMKSGETVTVLRAQSGPDHGSRPVAVINHDRNAWTRTAPDATTVLARSGITRSFNWWMAMLLFMAVAIGFAWPDIRLFMLEVDPGIFASLPDINIFALAADMIPALPGYDLAAAIPGFTGLVEQAGLPAWLSAQILALAIPLTLLALITFLARSWRILWAPVYAAAAAATGLALGGAAPLIPAMLALAGVALLFCAGGFINRTRDAGRLEGRIARLSENILRHPPAETVAVPAAGAALATTAATDGEDAPLGAGDGEADDLPSDEDLAAARNEDGGEAPAPAPSLRSAPEEQGVEDTSGRDMVLPPPPPLANRAVSETGDSGETAADTSANITAAASAMHAPDPAPVEPQALAEAPVREEAPEAGPEAPDTPATAMASALQAPSSEPQSAAPVTEPAPDTPAPEDIHAFAATDSAAQAPLLSSRDIADAEDAPDSPDAPEAAPVTPPATVRNGADTSDDVSDPFMAAEPAETDAAGVDGGGTPRQTDS